MSFQPFLDGKMKLVYIFILKLIEAKKKPDGIAITGVNINGIKVPFNLTEDDKSQLFELIELDPEEIHKKPVFFDDAIQKIPMKGNIRDLTSYIRERPELHQGKPFKYLTRNSKDILLGLEKRRREAKKAARSDDEWIYPMDPIDRDSLCPHEIEGLEEWDYGSDDTMNVTISNRKILLKDQVEVGHLVITGTGMLIYGEPNETDDKKPGGGKPGSGKTRKNGITLGGGEIIDVGDKNYDGVELMAKSITVEDGGQFWIGSRSCRFPYKGRISLYGDADAMDDVPIIGQKFLWCSNGATCEFHGQEKKTWTFLDEHAMTDNTPVDVREFTYPNTDNGLIIHRFRNSGAPYTSF